MVSTLRTTEGVSDPPKPRRTTSDPSQNRVYVVLNGLSSHRRQGQDLNSGQMYNIFKCILCGLYYLRVRRSERGRPCSTVYMTSCTDTLSACWEWASAPRRSGRRMDMATEDCWSPSRSDTHTHNYLSLFMFPSLLPPHILTQKGIN